MPAEYDLSRREFLRLAALTGIGIVAAFAERAFALPEIAAAEEQEFIPLARVSTSTPEWWMTDGIKAKLYPLPNNKVALALSVHVEESTPEPYGPKKGQQCVFITDLANQPNLRERPPQNAKLVSTIPDINFGHEADSELPLPMIGFGPYLAVASPVKRENSSSGNANTQLTIIDTDLEEVHLTFTPSSPNEGYTSWKTVLPNFTSIPGDSQSVLFGWLEKIRVEGKDETLFTSGRLSATNPNSLQELSPHKLKLPAKHLDLQPQLFTLGDKIYLAVEGEEGGRLVAYQCYPPGNWDENQPIELIAPDFPIANYSLAAGPAGYGVLALNYYDPASPAEIYFLKDNRDVFELGDCIILYDTFLTDLKVNLAQEKALAHVTGIDYDTARWFEVSPDEVVTQKQFPATSPLAGFTAMQISEEDGLIGFSLPRTIDKGSPLDINLYPC